jgi:hypothetical protein
MIEWRPVPEFPEYEVSDDGRVRAEADRIYDEIMRGVYQDARKDSSRYRRH